VASIRWIIVVNFARRRPSAAELVRVRQRDRNLRNRPIAEVREILERASKDNWRYEFEAESQQDADIILAGLTAAGINATSY